jgi:hypothetical protein
MPRFGMKALLLIAAIVAVWLSTLSGYTGAEDVRNIIRLLVFISAGSVALFGHGRRRAFAVGFFAVMFCLGTPIIKFAPQFSWLWTPAMYVNPTAAPSNAQPVTSAPATYVIPQATPSNTAPVAYAPANAVPVPATSIQIRRSFSVEVATTLDALLTLTLATIGGLISCYVYGASAKSNNR